MKDSKKVLNLLGVGLNSELAQKAVAAGYTLTKLRRAPKSELAQHFDDKELDLISEAVKRKRIPPNTLQRLIEECGWKCCVCWKYREEPPVIIHHIEEHSKTRDDSYDNLVVLCLNHHGLAHSKWKISRHPLPSELIRTKKREWIEALADFKAGRRPAPGDEQALGEPRSVRECLINHLSRQIAKEKNSKRYIPDIFVEVACVKDRARFFAHPVLFLEKVIESIQRVDLSAINRILGKLSLELICLDLPDGYKSAEGIGEIEYQCSFLLSVLQKAKNELDGLSRQGSGLSLGAIPAEKRYVYEDIKYLLWQMNYRPMRQIDSIIKDLEAIQSRVLFLIARAGQGKTNFVCDFAENVLRKRSLLCLFFTGRELRHVGPDRVGEYMVRSVFGDKYNGSMEEMLRDLKGLCLTDQVPVTIIIDGINEHNDIGVFSHRLEKLVEVILEYDFVKLILTCRSEYFDQRFHNFREASFADKICFVEDLEQRMSDTHRDHLLKAYFHFFKLYCPHLSWRAREALERDTLLLRMFCEAYGDHTAEEAIPLPQLTDVYRDEIFRIYLDKKLEGASQYYDSSSRLSVGVDARYQRVLSRIIHLMIEREQFANISVSDLDEEHHAALGEMIGEDIIFRKDLVEGRSLLDEKREVINFTFDEFRDFLLADHLVMKTFKEDAKAFESIVERLTDPKSPVAEGISKFIFFASKRPEGQKVLNVVTESPWYEEVFLERIFSVQEQFITQDDLREIESRFFENIRHSSWIIISLIPRYRTDLYSGLNIALLFQILDELDESEYDKLVRPVFSRRGVYILEEKRYCPVEELANDIREILMNEDLSCWPCFENLVELLIYLFDIRDRDHTCPAFTVFREFAETYTGVAIGLLERHTRIRNSGIAAQVWDMLTHLSRRSDMPKELVDEGCQMLSELNGGEDAKQSRLARAVALFLVSCRNSMGIELLDEIAERIEKIIAGPSWFGDYHDRVY